MIYVLIQSSNGGEHLTVCKDMDEVALFTDEGDEIIFLTKDEYEQIQRSWDEEAAWQGDDQ